MGKILVSASHFDVLCKEMWEYLEEHGHQVLYDSKRSFPAYSYEELKEILPKVDGALIGLDQYDKKVFEIPSPLKVVAKFGVGIDNIDIEAAKAHKVQVVNTPGMNANAVAELTVGFILDLLRKIPMLDEEMKRGVWNRYMGRELAGKTVGLVGFGAIARLTAKKLRAFEANVQAYDVYPNEKEAEKLNVELVSFEQILKSSDIISLHIPATTENRFLFSSKIFKEMKRGALLINTARGALVNLEDLVEAINEGYLGGAALDAFEEEPLPANSPVFRCPNLILTPHTGGETEEAYRRVSMMACQKICDVLAKGVM